VTGTEPVTVLCHALLTPGGKVVTYDDPDGLSHTPVLALAQDGQGYLWIGTEDGPVHFDGMEWAQPPGLAALRALDTWAFDTIEPHAVWVGTHGAGLALVNTRRPSYRCVATLTAADGLADDDIHVVCRDRASALWVGTHQGLAVVEGRRVAMCWTAACGIPPSGICALRADPCHGAWAGSLHGLLRFDRQNCLAHLTRRDGLPDDAIYALCLDPAGRLWAGTRNGIAVLVDGRVDAVIQHGLPSPEVRALCLDQAGRIWAGTARGLACIEHDAVHRCLTDEDHLPSSSVWSLLCDRDNRLWVGTESGLAMLPGQSVPVDTPPLRRAAVYSIAADRSHQTWIGTADGLVALAPDARAETMPSALPPALAGAAVLVTYRDGEGRIWAGGRHGGLYCLDPHTGAELAHVEHCDAVRCLIEGPPGLLWAGTLGAGIACIDMERREVVSRLTVAQGLPSDHILSFCFDRGFNRGDERERLWVGALGGVACVDCRQAVVVKTLGRGEGLPHLTVDGLALGPGDQLWGATQGGGLFRLDLASDRVCAVYTVADGLPSDTLYSCAFDTQGALWLGTARGLARYDPASGLCLALGRHHGMPADSCQQGALHLDEGGRLWVGTARGVALVAPRDVPREISPCAVYLAGMRIMGQRRTLVDGLKIDESEYDLVVEYGAVAFVAAAQVLYRTQLVGLDSAWSNPQPHRFARYTNLRPGRYIFRVAARGWGGQWSAPCEWHFRVVRGPEAEQLAHAQQRADAAEAAVRVRNDVLGAVAHDLRTPLTSIIGHADLLQLRLEGSDLPPRDWLLSEAGALRRVAHRMASMVEEIMDVVRLQMGQSLVMQPEPVDVTALLHAVVGALEVGVGRGATLHVEAPPDLFVQGDRARLERLIQNLVVNAIKYSPAGTPIDVSASPSADRVIVRVADSGVGIPAAEVPQLFTPFYRASTSRGIPGTGLGLASARAIVEQHGGQITVQSEEGRGTTVTVSLPRHATGLDPAPP
jgi:signal transduction histidine kinase/ligand-binding sensor domain-containing protein